MPSMNNILSTKFNARFIKLKPSQKIPAGSYKNEPTLTREQMLQAYRENYNFALTGNGEFMLIDLDTSDAHGGQDGVTVFKNWLKLNQIDPEKLFNNFTLMGRTPTGGIHLVFLQRDKQDLIGQHIDFLGDKSGVDLKGAVNNYIVCEPSVVKEGKYRWTNNVEPVLLPEELDIAIRKHKREQKIAEVRDTVDCQFEKNGMVFTTRKNPNYPVVDVFHTINNGWGTLGNRNDNLFKWSQEMRNITNFDTALAYATLANENSDEPLEDDEIFKSLESAFAYKPPVVDETERITLDGQTFVRFLGRYEQAHIGVSLADFMRNDNDSDPKHYQKAQLVMLLQPMQKLTPDALSKFGQLVDNVRSYLDVDEKGGQ